MDEIQILTQLKKQLVTFLDELIESFPDEPDFVIFRIFVNDRLPIVDIMNYIINELCPLKDMIKNKDEKFFLNYNVLFEKLDDQDTTKINHFKNLWLSNSLDIEDRETLWRWFSSFVSLGLKYKELKQN
jgi:hypothetical protein